MHQVPKAYVRGLSRCPKCNASPGYRCVGVKGQLRSRNHIKRVQQYNVDVGINFPT